MTKSKSNERLSNGIRSPLGIRENSSRLKKVDFTIPNYVADEVNREIENIEAHKDFNPSTIFNSDISCLCGHPCCYREDYSQYIPRGHYTRSEALKRYSKAMMWYGRMAFSAQGRQ